MNTGLKLLEDEQKRTFAAIVLFAVLILFGIVSISLLEPSNASGGTKTIWWDHAESATWLMNSIQTHSDFGISKNSDWKNTSPLFFDQINRLILDAEN